MRNTSTKIALKQSDNFKFASLSKSITVGRNLNHLKCMQTLFTHIRTEDPWQGHTIRMFLQQLYRTVLKNALTRILYLSRSLSLTSSLLFWTWQQAVNGKNNEESFLTSSRYRSMNTRTLEHVGHQRTNERRERGEEHALFQVHSQGRHDFQVRITNECNRERQKCVCIHLFLCIDVACLCTLVCVFMCGGLAINRVRPDIQ